MIILVMMQMDKPYSSIKILPLMYFLGLVLFVSKENYSRFSSVLLIILYFFKMNVLPILLAYGEFYSEIYESIYLPHWNEAIFYSIIEWYTVAISLTLSLKLYKNHKRRIVIMKRLSTKRFIHSNLTFPIMISFLILILGSLVIINRDLLNYTYFIWQTATEAQPSPTYYIYMVLFEVARIVFVLYIVRVLYVNKMPFMRVSASFILLANLCVMSSFRIISIFIFIVAYVYMAYKDKKYLKFYIAIMAIFLAGAVLFIMIVTSNMKSNIMISRVFNIYFGGYMVMATGLSIDMEESIRIFLNDIWNGNLLLTAIWGTKYSSTDVMNANVNRTAIGTFYQLYVQSKAFFGFLAPVPISMITWFLTFIENKFTFDEYEYHKILYLFVIISVSFFMIMYSLTMVINFILYRLSLILLMIYINNRIRIVYKK